MQEGAKLRRASEEQHSGSIPQLPLSGKCVIVSRAATQAGALSSELWALGAKVVEIPFIEIRRPSSLKPLDDALRDHAGYDWLILTSVNGVAVFFERLAKLRIPLENLSHLQVAAIGPATAKAIHNRGLRVDVIPKEYVAESVVASLKEQVRGKRVLLVRAKVARDVIPTELRKAGAQVEVKEAYQTVIPRASRRRLRSALKDQSERPDVITFTSSSTARSFVDLAGEEIVYSGVLDGVNLASIGPVTSRTLEELKLHPSIQAKEYTIPGLVDAIVEYFR